MKRLAVFIFILLILVIGGSVWLYQKLEVQEKAELFDALPPSASFFIEIDEWAKFKSNFDSTEYYDLFSSLGAMQKLLNQTDALDHLLAKPDSGQSLFDNRKLLIQVALTNAGEYDLLYLIETRNLDKETFRNFIQDFSDVRKIEERTYKGLGIFEAATDQGLLTIAFYRGILMASFTPFLVEESVEQLNKTPWLPQDREFQEIKKLSSGNAGVLAYMKISEEALLTELLLDQEHAVLKSFVRKFASWLQLEITFEKKSLLLNGYAIAGDSTFLGEYSKQSPGAMEIERVLPLNTALFVNTQAPINQIQGQSQFINYFKGWAGNSRGFAIGETLDENWGKALCFYIRCNDSERAAESLSELSAIQDQTFELEYNGYKIARLNGNDFDALFDFPDMGLKDPFYTIISDFVLLANTERALKNIISDYLNGRTLSRDKDYLNFSRKISSNSNFSLHIQPSYAYRLVKSLLNASLRKSLDEEEKNWKKMSHSAIQFSNFNGVYFTNAILSYQEESSQQSVGTQKLWEMELNAPVSKGPFLLKNHNNGYEEILVQDAENKIYLIDRTGKLLWQKDIDESISGNDIAQMDYYKNGKLQMVFNTENKIHIIDREGNNVAGFPIKIPVNSSNALLTTNYDNKHIYRYFVAGRNRIYGFYQSGKPLPGWSPKPRAGTITQPMEYCQINGIDYLIAANEAGELFYFDRRGEKKVSPILTKTEFEFPFAFIERKNDFNLYNFSKEDAELLVVDMQGNFNKTATADSLEFFDFNAFDIDGDGNTEIIFTDTNTVYVYNKKMEQLKSVSSPINIDSEVFKVDQYLGFLSKKDGQIWLLDAHYSAVDVFPMEGYSRFSISDMFKNGQEILIGTNAKNKVVAYKLGI